MRVNLNTKEVKPDTEKEKFLKEKISDNKNNTDIDDERRQIKRELSSFGRGILCQKSSRKF